MKFSSELLDLFWHFGCLKHWVYPFHQKNFKHFNNWKYPLCTCSEHLLSKMELISASHLDITGHLKIQCYMWFLFSLSFLVPGLRRRGGMARYGKSIIHVNLQSMMVIKLSHTPVLTHSHCELCRRRQLESFRSVSQARQIVKYCFEQKKLLTMLLLQLSCVNLLLVVLRCS